MHCQKSLNGPGTVLNGFPSKTACKNNWKKINVFSICTLKNFRLNNASFDLMLSKS